MVAEPGADVDAAELVRWCRDRLSHYKCPAVLELTDVELRTAMGKVNKRKLRDDYLAAQWAAPGRVTGVGNRDR